jgi:hypothetical protein
MGGHGCYVLAPKKNGGLYDLTHLNRKIEIMTQNDHNATKKMIETITTNSFILKILRM